MLRYIGLSVGLSLVPQVSQPHGSLTPLDNRSLQRKEVQTLLWLLTLRIGLFLRIISRFLSLFLCYLPLTLCFHYCLGLSRRLCSATSISCACNSHSHVFQCLLHTLWTMSLALCLPALSVCLRALLPHWFLCFLLAFASSILCIYPLLFTKN